MQEQERPLGTGHRVQPSHLGMRLGGITGLLQGHITHPEWNRARTPDFLVLPVRYICFLLSGCLEEESGAQQRSRSPALEARRAWARNLLSLTVWLCDLQQVTQSHVPQFPQL